MLDTSRTSVMLDTPATDFDFRRAADIAAAVASGRSERVSVVEAALARIRERDPVLNSFTAVTAERALLRARGDRRHARARRARSARSPACRSR